MKVICTAEKWTQSPGCLDKITPVKDGIYEVEASKRDFDGVLYYKLVGFLDGYISASFRDLDDYLEQFTASLTKELTEIKEFELV